MTPRTSRLRRLVPAVAATLLALTLAACGDSGEMASGDNGQESSDDTKKEAAPSAKDGTDYEACRDGRCEVVVSEEMDITVPGETKKVVTVTGISDEEVAVKCEFASEGASGSVSAVLAAGEETVLGCQDLDVRISDVADGSAILEFTPGENPLGLSGRSDDTVNGG